MSDGSLAYAAPDKLPSDAHAVNFLHLGEGTAVQNPTGKFQWLGSDNSYWFACRTSREAYKVYKQMTSYGPKDLSGCTVVECAAINA